MKKAPKEALKEILRWLTFLVISGLINVAPYAPTHLIPEVVKIADFELPMRLFIVAYVIPAILRFADKWMHEYNKNKFESEGKSMGILPY